MTLSGGLGCDCCNGVCSLQTITDSSTDVSFNNLNFLILTESLIYTKLQNQSLFLFLFFLLSTLLLDSSSSTSSYFSSSSTSSTYLGSSGTLIYLITASSSSSGYSGFEISSY